MDLSGVSSAVPRVCNIGTASGDDRGFQHDMTEAGRVAGFDLTHLSLFSMPNVEDIEGHLMAQDVVWVNGGSVANLLAVWRVHGLDAILRRVWQAGVVLAGVSAGSICWYQGGTTDSFGPELRAVTNGLGFLPYASGVHYDSEAGRRPLVHELVAAGTLPDDALQRRRCRHPLPRHRDGGGRQRGGRQGCLRRHARRRQGPRGAPGRAAPGLSLSDRAAPDPTAPRPARVRRRG